MKNLYPTRTGTEYTINDRSAPTYWGPLTPSQIESYSNNGYLVLRSVYGEETVRAAKIVCENIFSGKTKCYTNTEPKSNQVRSALDVIRLDGLSQMMDKNMTATSQAILGGETYVHQSRINYKYGKSANGWNWHSDFETWNSKDGMPDMRCFTAMVCIDSNTIENGCLNVIPKSHLSFIGCPKVDGLSAESEFSEQIEGVPSEDVIARLMRKIGTSVVPIECSAGDVVLFDCNTLHYSGPNTTNEKRTNLYIVFNSVHNKLVKPFSGSDKRPEEMAKTIH